MESMIGIHPVIQKLDFKHKGRINLFLLDGRILSVPLTQYPSIKKMNTAQRNKYTIVNDQIILFQNTNQVYHLQDFMGREIDYVYQG